MSTSNTDDWIDEHVIVSHWPPEKPEKKPRRRKGNHRPLTGLPAMMHDLLEAADRHDRVFGRVTTSEGKRTPPKTEGELHHLSTGLAGRSRYDEDNR